MNVYIRHSFNALELLCFGRNINNKTKIVINNSRHYTKCFNSIYNGLAVNTSRYKVTNNYDHHRNLQDRQNVQLTIYNSFTLSAINNGGKKSKDKSAKAKSKSSSDLDDILDELSDDEDEETSQPLERQEYQGKRTPAFLFIDGLFKGGSSKGKSKGGKGSSSRSHAHHVDYQDVINVIDIESYWNKLEEVINNQRHFFVQHINIRSANALDELEIELEGDKFPLKEVASISKRDPKRVVIDSSTFPQATVSIMQTLRASTLNLNPQQEGTRIYVAIPKVTRETRETLAKSARNKMNETKIELRNIQNEYTKQVVDKQSEGASSISKDDFAGVKNIIMAVEQQFLYIAEEDTQKKQKDLLNKT